MFGYESLSVDFLSANQWLGWLSLVVLIAGGIWLYRKTNPPLPLPIRVTLSALRIIAVVALMGALLEPVISYTRSVERPVRMSVLIDGSGSMEQVEDSLSRRERVDSLLSSERFGSINQQTELEFYFVADSLSEKSEGLNPDRTAIGDALVSLGGLQLSDPADYWMLLSDGNNNFGRDPLTIPVAGLPPIVAINTARTGNQFDIGLDRIDYNKVVFAGQGTTVKVRLNWYQAQGKKIEVALMDGTRSLAVVELNITQESGFGEVDLKYLPLQPGKKMLKVVVTTDGNEYLHNNTQAIALKVLKSKLRVLLVSQNPDYELSFLKRFLDKSEKYEAELVVLNHRAGNLRSAFPERQAQLNRYDLCVLHDLDPQLIDQRQELIRSFLSDRGGAIWVLMGENFAGHSGADWFDQLLPFGPSGPDIPMRGEIHGEPREDQLFHPIIRVADTRAGIRDVWATLPPFRSVIHCDQVNPQATILVTANAGRGAAYQVPLIGFLRHGPGKILASAAAPFWSWGFANLGLGEDDSKYDLFLEGAISWLTVPDDYDPVRVAPVKEIFTRGEALLFEGLAFDQGYRPIPGVTGVVALEHDSTRERFEADLIETDEGVFAAEFHGLPSGTYQFEGRLEKEERNLKENEGLVQVEKFSLEEFDQGGKPDILKGLAEKTGGAYLTIAGFDQIDEILSLASVKETAEHELSLWNNYWLLILFVAAMALEWTLRKFRHLL